MADLQRTQTSTRAGRFVTQPSGYAAFVPSPLPPEPGLTIDQGLLAALSSADQALGRLDGIVKVVPDPDFFVGMYVRREAVLSSQIEGTQSTLEDLLEAELEPDRDRPGSDVGDIVNYVRAMNFGLDRLSTLPLSLRLIREIHAELLRNGRGAHSDPGNFRRTQNWIGPPGAGLAQATFVPPPVPELQAALAEFERFLHTPSGLPVIVDVGLAHAQFETIHPFLDGNGRVGRLLITLLLVRSGALRRPLLYLSHYFKLHRAEYYDRLTAIRLAGDWEGWMGFFLRGVAATAVEAAATAEQIFELRETARTAIVDAKLAQHGLPLLAVLFQRPLLNVTVAAELIGTSFPTANRVIRMLEELSYVREITGQRRRRVYRFEPYLALFTELDVAGGRAGVQATGAAPGDAGHSPM